MLRVPVPHFCFPDSPRGTLPLPSFLKIHTACFACFASLPKIHTARFASLPRTSLLKFDDLARTKVRYRILHLRQPLSLAPGSITAYGLFKHRIQMENAMLKAKAEELARKNGGQNNTVTMVDSNRAPVIAGPSNLRKCALSSENELRFILSNRAPVIVGPSNLRKRVLSSENELHFYSFKSCSRHSRTFKSAKTCFEF